MTPEENIKDCALRIGFSKVGIAKAGKLEEEGDRLLAWLGKRYHAGMNWMERHERKRSDPREILPSARSIISVALNYYDRTPHSQRDTSGKISRYAWGDDYHGIVEGKLNQLLDWILREFPGTQGKVYVDTGPVMDKAWAQRAGVGWQGKHTNVITQEFGSWVFLGEIITDIELQPDQPAMDHCGSCTLCIDACPTDAIVEPYVVDSNRCISYLTIEHRGDIDGSLAEQFANWIYGCDICQDVCPWNEKFSQECREHAFAPREWNIEPDLLSMAEMTQEEFTSRFKGSPIKRTKHSGLIRNVNAVLSHNNARPEHKTESSNEYARNFRKR